MSMQTAHARIKQAERDLLARWETTLMSWQDDNARRFATEQLEPLLAKARVAREAMIHLENILSTLRHDCG